MQDIETVYGPRRYFGLTDVAQGPITATIATVDLEKARDGHLRFVLTLEGHGRCLSLTRKNARSMAFHFGGENPDDTWPGKRIVLYAATEPYHGEMRDVLRVRAADPDPEQKPGFATQARQALSGLSKDDKP
jgi:hypothetical protein